MGSGCSTEMATQTVEFVQNVATCYGYESAETRSQRIEEEIQVQRTHSLTEIKLLLLGSGEAGKSTLVKQVRLDHSLFKQIW